MADHRPARYIERDDDGYETVVYRASDLGMCERAIIATARGLVGAPRPAWFQEILDEGALCEGQIADKWDTQTGIPTVNDQLEVELEVGEIDGRRVIVRGHIDGEAAFDDQGRDSCTGREYKKFRDSTWGKFQTQGVECQPNYPWQVSIYMHARGYDELEFVGGHLTGYRDNDGKLHATPYDDEVAPPMSEWRLPVIGEVECKRLLAPPIPLKDIIKRVARIERLINTGFDPTEVNCNKSKFPCPFFQMHDVDETAEYTLPKDAHTSAVVKTLITKDNRIAKLQAELKQLEAERKTAFGQLREVIEAAGHEANDAALIKYGNHTFRRKRYHVPEAAAPRKAYDVDSLSVERDKGDK